MTHISRRKVIAQLGEIERGLDTSKTKFLYVYKR